MSILGRISQDRMGEELAKKLVYMGHGRAELVEIDYSNHYVKLRFYNSFNAIGYENSDKPVCHYMRGLFAAGGSVLLNDELHCIATKCKGMGHEYCEFEILTPEEEEKHKIQ